jgi:Ca-activated chloride channel family protein
MKNQKLEIGNWKLYFRILICFMVLSSGFANAQSGERKLIREGNKLYKEKKFSDAEVEYKKSLGLNKNSIPGNYNLGNAYYKEGKFDEASQQYQSILSNKDLNPDQKAKAFHNIGNSLLESKKFPESIDAYKNALKLNPKDNDTRYNLAYAQSMLQQQQQQQQQNKNDQNKDQDKKDQKKKDQQQQQKQDKQQQEKQAQEKKNISKEDAEKILQALNNDEKNTQKKLNKKEGTRIQIEKNW